MDEYVLQPGERIDGCIIVEAIGKGGVAQVYLAHCGRLGEVALKLVTDQSIDYRDFFNEVMAMGLVNHLPYFVKFCGSSGISAHYPYILMEYMRGGDLRKRMQLSGKIKMEEALRIALTIGYALKEMHDIGMVHRDVSPDNIFFDERNQAKLGDMGFAATQQQLYRMVFKKSYTDPYVIQGGAFSPKSDIYSLGVTLYEMFGGNPRKGEILKEIKALGLPDHLKRLLENMCGFELEKRYEAEKLIEEMSPYIVMDSSTYLRTEPETESKRPDLKDIENRIFRSFLEKDREKTFVDRWIGKKESLFKGLKDDLQEIISRSVLFSLTSIRGKYPNCYLGLEHILWVFLEEDTYLSKALSRHNISAKQVRETIFGSLNKIKCLPASEAISDRLEKLLAAAKKRFPDGVGNREFVRYLLGEETFFTHLLRVEGVEPELVQKEVEI